MSLRLRINVIIVAMMTAFIVVLLWVDFLATRRAIYEAVSYTHLTLPTN